MSTAPRRQQGAGNPFAFLALMCGITSWVPLIIVITFPLTLVFFVAAHVFAWRRGLPRRLNAAWTGLVLAALSLAVQGALTGIAGIPGWIAEARRDPAPVAPEGLDAGADAPADAFAPFAVRSDAPPPPPPEPTPEERLPPHVRRLPPIGARPPAALPMRFEVGPAGALAVGKVPTSNDAARLETAIRGFLGQGSEVRLDVVGGVGTHAWEQAVSRCLEEVGELVRGTCLVEGATLTLTGLVESEASVERVTREFAAALPPPYRALAVELAVADDAALRAWDLAAGAR